MGRLTLLCTDGMCQMGKREPARGASSRREWRGRVQRCFHHAVAGMVVEAGTRTFVIGTWLVERRNALRLITLNDYALGELFGGCAGFESQLANQGYRVLGLISSLEELEATQLRHPGLQMTPWSPDLPEGEDEPPAVLLACLNGISY